MIRGQKYRFINNSGGSHPFYIQSAGSAYSTGVTGNGNTSGNIDFVPRNDAPANLQYNCTAHGGMLGNIYIVGQYMANGANNRVLTATGSYGINGESNLTFDGTTLSCGGQFSGNGSLLTNLNAGNLTGTIDDARLPSTISSDITGNAASADTVDVGTANANQNYYPVFTETSGSGKTVNIDGGNNLTYNPGTNTLTAGTLSATNVTATSELHIGSYSNISSGIYNFTASAGSAVTADSTAVGSANAIEYTIFVSNGSNIQTQKVLIMDNGTTAYIQEFAAMSNPNLIATFSADVNSGNVRLRATPETGISGSTTIKFTKMIIE